MLATVTRDDYPSGPTLDGCEGWIYRDHSPTRLQCGSGLTKQLTGLRIIEMVEQRNGKYEVEAIGREIKHGCVGHMKLRPVADAYAGSSDVLLTDINTHVAGVLKVARKLTGSAT
jgi:hypothetical protein